MDISYSLLALLLVIHEVCVQSVTVEAFTGDSVILPCSAVRYEKDVFWRHNTKSVFDVIDGEVNFDDQDASYTGRVRGFNSEFKNGNYSIRLSDVKPADTGTYTCQIPDFRTFSVELKIKERTPSERKRDGTNSGVMISAGGPSVFLLVYVLLVYVLLCGFAV